MRFLSARDFWVLLVNFAGRFAWLIKLKFLLLSSCDLGMFSAAGLLISLLLLSQCCSLGARGCSGHPWGTAREVVSESPQRVLENMKSRQRFTPRLVCNLVNICRELYKRLLTTLSACSLDSQGSRRHFEEQRLQDDIEQCQAFWGQMAMMRAMAAVAWILMPDFANP